MAEVLCKSGCRGIQGLEIRVSPKGGPLGALKGSLSNAYERGAFGYLVFGGKSFRRLGLQQKRFSCSDGKFRYSEIGSKLVQPRKHSLSLLARYLAIAS